MLTAEMLRREFSYDPVIGEFYRVNDLKTPIGHINSTGYPAHRIAGKVRLLHRLAWLYMTGEDCPTSIDHANRDRSDNRWCNLRAATPRQQIQNTGPRENNKVGIKGVYYRPGRNKWCAQIRVEGRKEHLGYFDAPDDAASAFMKRATEVHGLG